MSALNISQPENIIVKRCKNGFRKNRLTRKCEPYTPNTVKNKSKQVLNKSIKNNQQSLKVSPIKSKQSSLKNNQQSLKVSPIKSKLLSLKSKQGNKIKIAIIVPFRDTTKEKTRTKQLTVFINYITKYFDNTDKINADKIEYKIFIIEQSDDARKFNRGKLLNIGFDIAKKQHFDNYVFHDVDLLPSKELRDDYLKYLAPLDVIHIAAVWPRYNMNPTYLGGITIFTEQGFKHTNGFPNNFWGWGGEDDELYERVVDSGGMNIIKSSKGSIKDLENMNLGQKMTYLKKTKEKFMFKFEMIAMHNKTWKENGLKNLKYSIISMQQCLENKTIKPKNIKSKCVRIIVDVQLNGDIGDKHTK